MSAQFSWVRRIAAQIGRYVVAARFHDADRPGEEVLRLRRAALAGYDVPEPAVRDASPLARSMFTRRPVSIPDLADDGVHVPDRQLLAEAGFRSSVAVPLILNGDCLGAALIHARYAEAFERVTCNSAARFDTEGFIEPGRLEFSDELTALASRSLHVQRLEKVIAQAETEGDKLVLLVFDIVGLAKVNESLGHRAGDTLLQLLADRLEQVFRETRLLCHLGGGQFAITLKHGQAEHEAETDLWSRMQALLEEPFRVDHRDLQLSIKAGFSHYPENGRDAEELLQRAETALDYAKHSHEQYIRHNPEISLAATEQLNMSNRLRKMTVHRTFALHYQPKVRAESGELVGAEALLRWPGSDASPAEFVPVLESTGLIDEVGRWVVSQALADSARFPRLPCGNALPIAVNVSPLQLRRDDFADAFLEMLAAEGADGAQIEIEVTESMLMADPARAMASLARLREAGVTVAVDDFGTGHSSLQVLSYLPVDVLKVDRCFVEDIASNDRHRLVVGTATKLAQSLGLRTVAEGVETEEQRSLVAALGCDEFQGYLVSAAMPAREFGLWMMKHAPAAAYRGAMPDGNERTPGRNWRPSNGADQH